MVPSLSQASYWERLGTLLDNESTVSFNFKIKLKILHFFHHKCSMSPVMLWQLKVLQLPRNRLQEGIPLPVFHLL